MSNIIDFSAIKMERMQKRFDEIVEEHDMIHEMAADFAISAVMDIVEASAEVGFDVMDNPDVIRDMLMVVESIRAVIHRINGDEMEFHKISDRMFEDIEDTKGALLNFLEEFSE